jgi:HAD superfamily hydrolase (TIGR01458 family)
MRWQGFLLDVGGVLRVGSAAAPGAAETVAWLREARVPFRLLSNTTTTSRGALAEELTAMGMPIAPDEILTATTATAAHLRSVGGTSLFLVSAAARADLGGLPEAEVGARHVVVGDTDQVFTRDAMNRAFRALRAGADLIAMARNRWFPSPDGPVVDIGAVIAALEYAAEVRATLVGKPARAFFLQGARALGLPPERVAMVGDDAEADVEGAQAAGLGGIFVGAAWDRPGQPDAIIGTIGGLLAATV